MISGIRYYQRNFGFAAVLAVFANRIFGRPPKITAYPPGIPHAIQVRIKTSDESVYREILLQGEYDFDLHFPPKTIIDAGANIGMSSVYFAHKYPEAKVIAIEAEASNFALLAQNVRPYRNIIPVHAALWNHDGEISVSEPDPSIGAGNWAFITHEGPGVKVRAITMRTLLKEMLGGSVDLLKIDIEGSEKEVFESCDWISDVRCVMIDLHDRFKPGCSEAVNSVMQGFTKLQRGGTTLYLPNSLSPRHADTA
jgi:FkbM family methyltransferase